MKDETKELKRKLNAAINGLNAIKAGFGENAQPSLQYIEYITKKTLSEIL